MCQAQNYEMSVALFSERPARVASIWRRRQARSQSTRSQRFRVEEPACLVTDGYRWWWHESSLREGSSPMPGLCDAMASCNQEGSSQVMRRVRRVHVREYVRPAKPDSSESDLWPSAGHPHNHPTLATVRWREPPSSTLRSSRGGRHTQPHRPCRGRRSWHRGY